MAYDEFLADRIRRIFQQKKSDFYEKKMFGGLCFMVEDKMCCGIMYNKKQETDLFMGRIGEEAMEDAMKKPGSHPMAFTGRPMKGFIFVSPEGYDAEKDLEQWVQLCLDFNPFAKASKKRKK